MSHPAGPAELTPRQQLLWGIHDFSAGRGIEIGPLHQPIAVRPRADVRYVDVFDRATLQENYRDDPFVPADQISEVDHALFDGARVRSIPEVLGAAEYDWVMASHVVEHVPDLIGWLGQIAHVLRDGGNLVLAIPDRRYCFDLHRPGTSVGQLLQAHEAGDTIPSVRAVYDYTRGHASVRPPMIWSGNPVGLDKRIYSLETVLDRVARARAGEYIDSHVWLFTPGDFLDQLVELRTLGLSEWKVSRLVPTPRDQLEFYAVLTRLPRDRDAWTGELLADEPVPSVLPDWLDEWARLVRSTSSAQAELAEARAALKRTRRQLKTVSAREQARLGVRLRRRLRRSPAGPLLASAYRSLTRRGR